MGAKANEEAEAQAKAEADAEEAKAKVEEEAKAKTEAALSPEEQIASLKQQIKQATDDGEYAKIASLVQQLEGLQRIETLKQQIKQATDDGEYSKIPVLVQQLEALQKPPTAKEQKWQFWKVEWATRQGLEAYVTRYRDSEIMNPSVPSDIKPMVFENGKMVDFPPPTKSICSPNQTSSFQVQAQA